ncbi:hypothetical protein GCM10023082_66070 [Streptomyces tremellae]|uniref:Uncharacterized protein n=1 Tax=Streptomyces tremellae TaxID=1124239 RepID=A0ABP7GHT3_9ACTN
MVCEDTTRGGVCAGTATGAHMSGFCNPFPYFSPRPHAVPHSVSVSGDGPDAGTVGAP